MLMKTKMNTAEFLRSPVSNLWCYDGDIHCYLKKSLRPGELLIINIKNARGTRQRNVFINPRHRKTGKFRTYMDMLESEARQHGYNRIVVEGIMNEFLPGVLERRGYKFVSTDGCTSKYAITI